jgi:lactobin A/cerein 7B family class IIb bacteriocin
MEITMNQSLLLSASDQHPLALELLGDDELATISGGLTPVVFGAAIVGGVLGAAVIGVAVGVAFYYFSREE